MSRENRFRKCQGWRCRCLTIGGLSGGCVRACLGDSGHSKGKCLTLPGVCISSSACRVARSTASCPARSPGCPTVRPKGYSIAATRGVLTAAVKSGILESVMVVMPAASIFLCTSPTDQQQNGQAGIRTTTSTSSSWRLLVMTGVLSSNSCSGCRL